VESGAAVTISFEDFHAVTSTVYRFAYALDNSDWTLMRSLFADEVEVDTTRTGQRGSTPGVIPAEDFVWQVKVSETGFEGTQLLLGNPIVDADGDRADVTLCFYGEHVAAITTGDPWYTIGGYQHWGLTRRSDGWRIDRFTLAPLWTRGNRDVMSLGLRRGAERLRERGDTPPAHIVDKLDNW
jgi:hypothetical protein